MAPEKHIFDLPDNLAGMSDEELDAFADGLYDSLIAAVDGDPPPAS